MHCFMLFKEAYMVCQAVLSFEAKPHSQIIPGAELGGFEKSDEFEKNYIEMQAYNLQNNTPQSPKP